MNSVYICLFGLFAVGCSLPNKGVLKQHKNIITYNNDTRGGSANITDYPFVVSITRPGSVNYSLAVESGAILNKHWILTSANQFHNDSVSNVTIRVGSSDATYGGQLLNVSKVIVHERYLGNLSYNIALLKTGNKIRFSRQVRPVKLSKSPPNAATNYTVVGFGSSSHNVSVNSSSSGLRVATVYVLPVYRNHSSNLTDSYFYAYTSGISPSIGAPLVHNGKLFGYYLGGQSWNTSVYNQSAAYTNVAALRSWILQKIWQDLYGDEME